jgi:uncharacterized protein involved in exopolysaccharide biosynthesis
MDQIFEILSRRRWYFLVPFLVVFLVPAMATLIFMRSYEANSLVWLDSDVSIVPLLSDQPPATGEERLIQPEADTLQQLVQSRTFLTDVIAATPMKEKMDTPQGRESTIDAVRSDLSVEVVGPNSVRITYFGSSPAEAVVVVKATTDKFFDWVRTGAREKGEESIEFFTTRVAAHEEELAQTQEELRAYKEEHPETEQLEIRDRTLTPSEITVSPAVQLRFEQLKTEEEYVRALYESSLEDLAQIRSLAAAEEERYLTGMRLVDAPVEPTSFSKKRLALADFLALMAALAIGAVAVTVAELTDHTFRSSRDAEEALDVPVLLEIHKPAPPPAEEPAPERSEQSSEASEA